MLAKKLEYPLAKAYVPADSIIYQSFGTKISPVAVHHELTIYNHLIQNDW